MKRLLILIPILFLLAACDTPWENSKTRAQADVIEMNAQVDAAAREQELKQDEEMHALAVEQEKLRLQTQTENRAQWQRSINTMIEYGMFASTVTLTMIVLSLGVGLAIFIVGTGRAKAVVAIQAATLQANLIPLDAKTHQYPLLRHVQDGVWSLLNPNNGANYLLKESNEADRQLIAAMQSVQFIGELATQTRTSKGEAAQSMSMLSVPIIAARDDVVIVGKDGIEVMG